jgi:hypothetical protein
MYPLVSTGNVEDRDPFGPNLGVEGFPEFSAADQAKRQVTSLTD